MRELIVVDGFNVLHAGILRGRDRAGWWRPEARAKLLEALAPLAGGPAELRVVFDARGDDSEGVAPIGAHSADRRGDQPSAGGRAGSGAEGADWRGGGGIVVVLAPSADDRIVEEVLREAPHRQVTVASSDRELGRRVRGAGGRVVGAAAFLAGLG